MKYDILYFYKGGTESGEWYPACVLPSEFKEAEKRLHLAGYFTRRGKRSIGAPEGPPAEMLAGKQVPDVIPWSDVVAARKYF